jgi:hypothetical protein
MNNYVGNIIHKTYLVTLNFLRQRDRFIILNNHREVLHGVDRMYYFYDKLEIFKWRNNYQFFY